VANRFDKDIPVVVLKTRYPNLAVRLLADRDKGQVVWESEELDENGNVVGQFSVVLGTLHLLHLEGIIKDLREARKALTPRRRLDKTEIRPPTTVGGARSGGALESV